MPKKIYHVVGEPTLRNLKIIIRQNTIQNLPVMVEDIEIAEKIFGPGVYILKGRTMRQSPKVAVDNFNDIPRKLIDNNQ